MAIIVAVARPTLAGSNRYRPQHRRRHSGAWILSRRHGDRDRAFDSGGALGPDSGPAADPDLDDGKSLARRTRHAAAMDGVAARARRRRADPARPADGRRGRLGLARLRRLAGQHHPRHALPAPLLQRDRLARRQSRAIRRGRRFSSALGAWLFETNVVHWTTEFMLALAWLAVVLSIGSIGLLYWLIRRSAATSVASLFYLVPAVTSLMAYVAVRRAAGCDLDRRHGRLRRGGAAGQPPRRLKSARWPQMRNCDIPGWCARTIPG